VAKLKEAAAIEDAIIDLSQPPYPAIPANELCGKLLLELNRPAQALIYFQRTLTRTPGRPKAIFGSHEQRKLWVTTRQRLSGIRNSCPFGNPLMLNFLSSRWQRIS
jgi:hypothetical protein